MPAIKLTTKRQATLPARVCKDLDLHPGDAILLEQRRIAGENVWVLRARKPDWSWVGAAGRHAREKAHGWQRVKAGIAKGWADRDRP